MDKRFEGLYFKQQTPRDGVVSVIAALHGEEASVQVVTPQGTLCEKFAGGEEAAGGYRIGGGLFSPAGLAVDMPGCRGAVLFHGLTPPRYNIMGPFATLPFMECRHKVVSLRHKTSGSLTVDGREYDFTGGLGYIEGDSGRSFPRRYLWTQCLFEEGSLMLSVADIPMGRAVFTGVIGFVYTGGHEIRLATYLGAKAQRSGTTVLVRQGELTFWAEMLSAPDRTLLAPADGKMVRTIREAPVCAARYRLFRGGKPLLALETDKASFEYEYEPSFSPPKSVIY
ncbi:MAG TPA: tocopherol cyclase family protein [Candidatus Acidoferrum sp.]|nr:tocopherol cyclase family protein [Candidatus Acidoferrum sp.]